MVDSEQERRSKRHTDTAPFVDRHGYGRLFDGDIEQVRTFIDRYAAQPILEPKYLDTPYLSAQGFDVCQLLDAVSLRKFAELQCSYSELLVRAFYKNLVYHQGSLSSRVKGISIDVTAEDWLQLTGYSFQPSEDADEAAILPQPFDGIHFGEFEDYDRGALIQSILRPRTAYPLLSRLSVKKLSIQARVLHYMVTHTILPRHSNHAVVQESDLFAMWAITEQASINWRHTICCQMREASHGSAAHLPYPTLVQRIMELKGVPMDDETMKKLTIHHRVGAKALNKMDIFFDGQAWQWDDDESYGDIPADAPAAAMDVDPADDQPPLQRAPRRARRVRTPPPPPSSASASSSQIHELPPPMEGRHYTTHDIMHYLLRIRLEVSELRSEVAALRPSTDTAAAEDEDEDSSSDAESSGSASSDDDIPSASTPPDDA